MQSIASKTLNDVRGFTSPSVDLLKPFQKVKGGFPARGASWDCDSRWTKNNVKPIRNRAQSQRAKSFAVEFLVYIESILPVGIEVGVARRRQMRHTGVIDMLAFCLQLSRLRS